MTAALPALPARRRLQRWLIAGALGAVALVGLVLYLVGFLLG